MADPNGAPVRGGKAPPCTVVIFGATGDLTHRLVMPSKSSVATDI